MTNSNENHIELGATEALSEFATQTTFKSIPTKFIQSLKLFRLDYFGVAAYGAVHTESAAPFSNVIELLNGNQHGSSTVITKGDTYQLHYAALLNSAFAHSLDFDDTYVAGALHPGVSVISAALTEACTSSGQDFLSATSVGYEVTCRIGRALGAGSYERAFYNTSVAGIFGAVAAVGHPRKLNLATITSAFGIAGSKAAGSMQFLRMGLGTNGCILGLLLMMQFPPWPRTRFAPRSGLSAERPDSASIDATPEAHHISDGWTVPISFWVPKRHHRGRDDLLGSISIDIS